MPATKINLNHSKVRRIEGLDDLARILCPGNRSHQRIFLLVFVELKWAEGQFLSALEPIADKYGFSRRSLETVRAKMRRLGIIDHVSRFSRRYGYLEGWVFSSKFAGALRVLMEFPSRFKEKTGTNQEQKDRDVLLYV